MPPVRRRFQTPRRRSALRLLVGVSALAALGWILLGSYRSQPRSGRARGAGLLTVDRPFPPEGRFASDPYIGSRVSAECHPGESAFHARSGHAITLRPAGRVELARRLDGVTGVDPEWPEVRWSYRYRDGQLHIARKAPEGVEEWVADYVFGSGRHAATFLTVLDPKPPKVLEHRLSYYARKSGLGITPGHDTHPPPPGLTPQGGALPPRIARECFRCHATQISGRDEQRFDEEAMIPNVSCERCHGPGRAHVAAARRKAPDSELALPFGPGRWTADGMMTLCGSCHRHPSPTQVRQLQPDDPLLARFQPVGIMQTACYSQSNGAFSCVTCHDPHARVSHDRPAYDAACLSCHAAPGAPRLQSSRPRVEAPPCPVSPSEKCVECHMPQVDGGQGILFSDHWIRIRRPKGPSP